jgi:hypothetical protein
VAAGGLLGDGLGLLDLVEAGQPDDVATCLTAHPLVTEVNAAWVAGDRALTRAVEHTVATLLAQTARGREAPDADEYRRWPLLAPHLLHALTRQVHPLPRQLMAALVDAATTANQGLNHAGDYATADKLGSVTAAAAGRGLPADHPVALMLRSQIANTLLNKGQHAEAESRYRQMLPAAIRITGADSMLSLRIRHNLALARAHAGARDETDTLFRDLLPDVERAMGADSQFAVLNRNKCAGGAG